MDQDRVIGSKFDGQWHDIGTPERLLALDEQIRLESKKTSEFQADQRL
jgi:NDP-sugar pyrophosphorylase family protein